MSEPNTIPPSLGRKFLRAAESGNGKLVQAYIDDGFPVNYQDPKTLETALHAAAGSDARGVMRVLVATDKIDFLLRDKGGRLASELAYLYGEDPAAARWLGKRERKQGEDLGIKVTRRPMEMMPS